MQQSIWIVAFFTILIGVLSVAPYWYAYETIGPIPEKDQKLHFFYHDSELRYISRMREITEGNWPAASPVFYEYKSASAAQQPFGEAFYSLFTFGKSENLSQIVLISKFALPALLFLLVFFLTKKLLSSVDVLEPWTNTITAVFFAFIVVQGLGIHRPELFLNLVTQTFGEPALSKWTRTVNPIFGGLTLFSTLLVLIISRTNSFLSWRALTIGVLVGLSSAYLFSFVLTVLILMTMGIMHIVYRESSRFIELVVAALITMAINLNYFLSVFTPSETGVVDLTKNGFFFTHEPVVNKYLLLAMLIFVTTLLIARREMLWKDLFSLLWVKFSSALIIGSVVAYNFQIITGFTVWPGHFHQYTDFLALLILLLSGTKILDVLVRNLQHHKHTIESFIRVISIASLGFLVSLQIGSVRSVELLAENYVDSQRYVPIFKWLRTVHPIGDCVVFYPEPSNELNDFFTAYTNCDSYHSHYVFMGLPEDRIMHNYVAYLRLRGVTQDSIDDYLADNVRQWQDLFYADWVEKFADHLDPWLLKVAKPRQLEDYFSNTPKEIKTNFLESLNVPLEDYMASYKLDYIVVDHKWQYQPTRILQEPIYEANNISIYDFSTIYRDNQISLW